MRYLINKPILKKQFLFINVTTICHYVKFLGFTPLFEI
ncbi:MAG: hypothetical protein US78_C0005G0028 [Parcubacteria group bacterium GW2011_GWD1_38_16]|nr:MAG: hypothetical protein US78_C0005G0028 [Parcubacteria group bacterium GW2011_GWD1_38_16]